MKASCIVATFLFALSLDAQARTCTTSDFDAFAGSFYSSSHGCSGIKGIYGCKGWSGVTGVRLRPTGGEKPKLNVFLDGKDKSIIPGRKDNRAFLFDSSSEFVSCEGSEDRITIRFSDKKARATLKLDSGMVTFNHEFPVKDHGQSRTIKVNFALSLSQRK